MVNCLQSLIFNILLYKASIYDENSAYRPFAPARFNGKELQDINIKLSFLRSMRLLKKAGVVQRGGQQISLQQ